MGHAARAADAIWVTSDNPRTEDPSAIARDLTTAIGDHPSIVVELDRARAITAAIQSAAPPDVVLVCGKGHETEQIIGTKRIPFSDRAVANCACSRGSS